MMRRGRPPRFPLHALLLGAVLDVPCEPAAINATRTSLHNAAAYLRKAGSDLRFRIDRGPEGLNVTRVA